jgi:hypothetical protein
VDDGQRAIPGLFLCPLPSSQLTEGHYVWGALLKEQPSPHLSTYDTLVLCMCDVLVMMTGQHVTGL